MGMQEVILCHRKDKSPPATCDKNQNREPIDGIFASPRIRIAARGYAPFNSGCPSDHQYLWIDIPYRDAFGYSAPPHIAPTMRRLHNKDPHLVARYNSKVNIALVNEGLVTGLEEIDRWHRGRDGHTT
jgi:hypothetical protein